jgi:PAS domain S-box-containing protein
VKDERKTKKQLIQELSELRRRVAELEQAQTAHHESGATKEPRDLLSLFNALVDMVFVLDSAGQILHTNPAVQERLGYSAEELAGRPILAVHPPDQHTEATAIITDMLAGKETACHVPLLTKDGSRIPVETRVTRARWLGEDVLLGISRDLTEQRSIEEALRESEAKFRILAEQSPNMIFINRRGQVIYANERCEQAMGYTKEEYYSEEFDFLTLIAPKDRYLVKENFASHSQGQEVEPYEYSLVTKEGQRIEAILSTKLIEYAGELAILGTVTDITERKRAEDELQRSQARFQDLYENAPNAYFSVGVAGHIRQCNRRAAEMTGYTVEELTGMSVLDLYADAPDGRKKAAEALQRFQSGEAIRDEELQMQRADGTTLWISLTVNAIRDGQGEIIESRSVVADISKRKEIEQTLLQRAVELDALQRTVLDITSLPDLPTLLRTIVEHAAPLLDAKGGGLYLCEPDRQQVRCVVSYNTPEDYTGTTLSYGEGAAGTIALTGEPLIIDDYRTWPGRAAAFEDSQPFSAVLGVPMIWQGEVIGVIDLLQDTESVKFAQADLELLTLFAGHAAIAVQNARLYDQAQKEIAERKKAAEELWRRTFQLIALRDVGLELAAQLDPDALLHSIVSHAVELIEGTSGGLYVHRPEQRTLEWIVNIGAEIVPLGTTLQRGEGLSGRIWESGEPLVVNDYQLWEGRASIFSDLPPTAVVGVPVHWRDEFLGVLDVLAEPPRTFSPEDAELLSLFAAQAAVAIVNARLYEDARHHADELLVALNRLQEMDHLKNQFIQNVSHELRSPLALIRGYADLLASGELGDLAGEHQKPLEIIARRARMLGRLVDDITLLAAAESRRMEYEPVTIDDLVAAAVEDFQVAADSAGLILDAEIASSLAPISGEPIYLRRVLDNLLGNALKFTPAGGTITVRLEQKGEQVVLQVSDTGIGIAPEEHALIFDRFYQVDGSSKRRYGGVGLGLALVKEITEAHGGKVMVQSTVGQGSTFTVTLPARQGEDDEQ